MPRMTANEVSRIRRALAIGAGVACTLLITPAPRASPWSLHATGTMVGGWSDNLANAPEVAQEGEILPQSGAYTQIQPSLLFTLESPRAVHVATAALDLARYQAGVVPSATNFTMAYRGLLATTPLSEVGIDSALVLGDAGNTLTSGARDAAIAGASRFRSLTLGQSLRWQATRDWRLSQGASAAGVETDTGDGSNRSYNLGLQVGADRGWARTSLGLRGGVSYIAGDDVTGGPQLAVSAAASVRRDIDPRWSASGSAGVTSLTGVDSDTTRFAPTFDAGVTYLRPVGPVIATLGLSARKRIEPNLFLQTVTDTTGATLTGSIPLPWLRRGPDPIVQVNGSLGFDRAAQIVGGAATWNVYSADAAVQWSFHETTSMALRYQYFDTDIIDLGDQAMMEDPPVEDFYRHTILVQVSGRFPGRQAARLPDRTPLRVDRANEAPLGQGRRGTESENSVP